MSFPVLDGDMQWRAASVLSSARLSDATEEDRARALTAAYDPDGEWIASALRQADTDLTYARDDMPDAGGLVVASSQTHARRYAELLRRITGEAAVVAVSDDPKASKEIERFSAGTARWIVAVNMVAEGVDIPRLAVGVYASRYTTQMFFRQVVGRFVRMRNDGDMTTGRLYIPSLDNLVKYARDIERTVDKVIMEEETKARCSSGGEDIDGSPRPFIDVVPMGSSEATISQTIFRSDDFTADELDRAKRYCEAAGIRSVSVEEAARLLRFAGMQQPRREPEQSGQVSQSKPTVPLTEQKNRLRRRIRDLVNTHARNTATEHKMVHAKLNKLVRENSINAATIQSLERRITILTTWITAS
jgi:superfamily II DNA or RNA helicase